MVVVHLYSSQTTSKCLTVSIKPLGALPKVPRNKKDRILFLVPVRGRYSAPRGPCSPGPRPGYPAEQDKVPAP